MAPGPIIGFYVPLTRPLLLTCSQNSPKQARMDAFLSPNGRIPVRLLACENFIKCAQDNMLAAIDLYCEQRDNLQSLCLRSLLQKNVSVMKNFVEWNEWLERVAGEKGMHDVLTSELKLIRCLFANRMSNKVFEDRSKLTLSYYNSCALFNEAEKQGFESRIWGSYEHFLAMGCVNRPEVLHPVIISKPKWGDNTPLEYCDDFQRAAFLNSSQFDGDNIRSLEDRLDVVIHAYNYCFPDLTMSEAYSAKFMVELHDPTEMALAMTELAKIENMRIPSDVKKDVVIACALRIGNIFKEDLEENIPIAPLWRVSAKVVEDGTFKAIVVRAVCRVLDALRNQIDPSSVKYIA